MRPARPGRTRSPPRCGSPAGRWSRGCDRVAPSRGLRRGRPAPPPPPRAATNATRISAFAAAPFVENTSVIRRIGPNSPIAPAARRKVPKRVRSSPASLRTGISVPIAVVASAEPVNSSDSTSPGRARAASERIGQDQRQEPAENGKPKRAPADPLEVDLVAGEEEEHAQPETREEVEEVVGIGETQAAPGRCISRARSRRPRQAAAGGSTRSPPRTRPARRRRRPRERTRCRCRSCARGPIPQALVNASPGSRWTRPSPDPERVGRAGHRLHREAAPVDVGKRVSREQHQVPVGLVHPERELRRPSGYRSATRARPSSSRSRSVKQLSSMVAPIGRGAAKVVLGAVHGCAADRDAALVGPQHRPRGHAQDDRVHASARRPRGTGWAPAPVGARSRPAVGGGRAHLQPLVRERVLDGEGE